MARLRGKLLLGAALVSMAAAQSPTVSHAQNAVSDQKVPLSIAGQSLSDALRQLAEAAGLQLVYDTKITDGKTSPAIGGPMTSREALGKLLAGTGLDFQFTGDRTVLITARATDGVRSVGVVSVQGVTGAMPFGDMVSPVNGVNGSRDVEATEGTGSYTTGAASIVSKTPQTLRETPQSVSVMTAQRIQDQGLKNIEDVLQQLPGITSTPGVDSADFNIYSRGFQITNFSIDGGAPITFPGVRPILDMSEFDSVQLIRGANGMFGGYSDPGGTVNLVRKKPLDHNQFTYKQEIGSYDNYHEEADLTGPLTKDGRLRGRLVFSQNNQKYYYDIAKSHKTSVYGILEYDLTPKTLVSIGGNYLDQANTTNGGLPRYVDGPAIDFPVSTCLCLPFAKDRAEKEELFLIVNHSFTDKLSAKLNLTYNSQSLDSFFYGPFSVIPENAPAYLVLSGERSITPVRDFLADFTINGSFNIFNRVNEFVVGGNYEYRNQDGARSDIFYPIPLLSDIFHFDPSQYQDPTADLPGVTTALRNRTTQIGVYANLKLEFFKNLHLTTGIKYSYYKLKELDYYQNYDGNGNNLTQAAPPLNDSSHSTPNIAITYDFLRNFTLYGSHELTYQPQSYSRYTVGQSTPPPITGNNDELGVKWESPNKKINASAALYSIVQNNILNTSPDDPTKRIDSLTNRKSRGVDFEVVGEMLPRLQASLSYTYNKNSYNTRDGTAPATSYAPRTQIKAWVVYRGAPNGPLARFIGGFGVESQTSSYNASYVCGTIVTDVNAPCPEYINYHFTTKGYTTFGLKIGYKITENIEISIKGNNITNVKTYASSPFQAVYGYNFYVPPVNVLVSLNAKL